MTSFFPSKRFLNLAHALSPLTQQSSAPPRSSRHSPAMRRGTALALFALVTASLLSCSDARNKVAGKGADGKNNNADDGDELGLSSRPQLAALGGDPHTFEVANDMFLLDGEPFRILAGE